MVDSWKIMDLGTHNDKMCAEISTENTPNTNLLGPSAQIGRLFGIFWEKSPLHFHCLWLLLDEGPQKPVGPGHFSQWEDKQTSEWQNKFLDKTFPFLSSSRYHYIIHENLQQYLFIKEVQRTRRDIEQNRFMSLQILIILLRNSLYNGCGKTFPAQDSTAPSFGTLLAYVETTA